MFKLSNVFMEEVSEPAAAGDQTPQPVSAEETPPSSAAPDPSNWRSSLPPDLRDAPSLQDVPDVQTLAKQYMDTKAMVGSSIRVPTNEAGQEAVDAFTEKLLAHENLPLMRRPDPESPETMEALYKTLGRPEDVSGYAAPEGADAEMFGALAKDAFEAGLTKKQYEAMAAAQLNAQNQTVKNMEDERIAGVSQVKGEWGPAFEQKVGRAAIIAEKLGAPEKLVEAMKAGAVDAQTLRFLDTIATQMGAEGTPMAQEVGQVTAETVAELEQKISERTQRIITENLTPHDKQRLINANVEDRQRIIDAR